MKRINKDFHFRFRLIGVPRRVQKETKAIETLVKIPLLPQFVSRASLTFIFTFPANIYTVMRVKLQGENEPLHEYYIYFKTWIDGVFPSLWNFPESLCDFFPLDVYAHNRLANLFQRPPWRVHLVNNCLCSWIMGHVFNRERCLIYYLDLSKTSFSYRF